MREYFCENRLPISFLSDARPRGAFGAYLWRLSLCLQLGIAPTHRCLSLGRKGQLQPVVCPVDSIEEEAGICMVERNLVRADTTGFAPLAKGFRSLFRSACSLPKVQEE